MDKMPAWTWNSGRLDRCRQKLANGKKAPPIHGNRYWLHDTTWYVVSGSRHRRGSWAAAHRRCGGQRGGVPACALSAGCHPRQAVETVSDCTVLWVLVLSCRKNLGTLAPRPPKLGGRGATTNCHSRQIREASTPASRSPHPILPRSVGYRSDRRHADRRRSGLLQLQKRCAGWQSSRWQLPDRHD